MLAIASKPATPFDILCALTDRLTEFRRVRVSELTSEANGYAWGWLDGRGEAPIDDQAWRFYVAYGVHVAEMFNDYTTSYMPIYQAWQLFVAGKPLR